MSIRSRIKSALSKAKARSKASISKRKSQATKARAQVKSTVSKAVSRSKASAQSIKSGGRPNVTPTKRPTPTKVTQKPTTSPKGGRVTSSTTTKVLTYQDTRDDPSLSEDVKRKIIQARSKGYEFAVITKTTADKVQQSIELRRKGGGRIIEKTPFQDVATTIAVTGTDKPKSKPTFQEVQKNVVGYTLPAGLSDFEVIKKVAKEEAKNIPKTVLAGGVTSAFFRLAPAPLKLAGAVVLTGLVAKETIGQYLEYKRSPLLFKSKIPEKLTKGGISLAGFGFGGRTAGKAISKDIASQVGKTKVVTKFPEQQVVRQLELSGGGRQVRLDRPFKIDFPDFKLQRNIGVGKFKVNLYKNIEDKVKEQLPTQGTQNVILNVGEKTTTGTAFTDIVSPATGFRAGIRKRLGIFSPPKITSRVNRINTFTPFSPKKLLEPSPYARGLRLAPLIQPFTFRNVKQGQLFVGSEQFFIRGPSIRSRTGEPIPQRGAVTQLDPSGKTTKLRFTPSKELKRIQTVDETSFGVGLTVPIRRPKRTRYEEEVLRLQDVQLGKLKRSEVSTPISLPKIDSSAITKGFRPKLAQASRLSLLSSNVTRTQDVTKLQAIDVTKTQKTQLVDVTKTTTPTRTGIPPVPPFSPPTIPTFGFGFGGFGFGGAGGRRKGRQPKIGKELGGRFTRSFSAEVLGLKAPRKRKVKRRYTGFELRI